MKFSKIKYIERKTGEILTEKVPGEKYLKFLYYNPFGELPLNLIVKKKFFTEYYGKKMDSKESCKKISSFIEEAGINIEEAKKSIEEFISFNDFFYRELKDGKRPVNQDENVLVSPADGKISSSNLIEGDYYSVSTHAVKKNFRIFCENKREYSILSTEKFGDIAMFEVGATMVGGIRQTYIPDSFVKKGEEKGYFFFGGSTCVLVFEKDKIEIDKDLIENTKKGIETKVYMGERIGISHKR